MPTRRPRDCGRWVDKAARALMLLMALGTGLPLPSLAGKVGADVNADVDAFGHDQMSEAVLDAYAQSHTVRPLPLFNLPAGDHAAYWDNMVEQYQSAQLDFVAVWLKGNDQPATFANLVAAIKKRGLTGRITVMPFDDDPASWTAMWNNDHGNGYNYRTLFDVGAPANWTYVWDKNLKVFFQNVPDADRFKINGRPVYRIWSGAPAFLTNMNGNGSKLLAYVRQQCRATFGFDPYIMVSDDWIKNDPSSAAPGVVDAVCPWFTPVPGPNYSTWNVETWHGVTTGMCIPQFQISSMTDPNAGTWIVAPQHGTTLRDGLAATAGDPRCAATFIEGFDDYWENTTLWRARNLDADGKPLGDAETGYDYPNERLNIVRRCGNNPFPRDLREEAAGCDTFSGAVARPDASKGYRNGPIAVEDTTDPAGTGYDVSDTQPGETLTWLHVPMQGTMRLQVRAAAGRAGRRMHFVIDGNAYPSAAVPNAGASPWHTVDLGAVALPYDSDHTVSLVLDTGGIRVHDWRICETALPGGNYRVIDRLSGDALPGDWHLHALGHNRYAAAHAPAAAVQWTITPASDGLWSLAGAGTPPHAAAPKWSFAPTL